MKEYRVKGEESMVVVFFRVNNNDIEKRFFLCGGMFLDVPEHSWNMIRSTTITRVSAIEWMVDAVIPFPIWQNLVMDMNKDDLIKPMTDDDFMCTEQRELSE